MAPKFEGNLAHALPQNDTEEGRVSGVELKKDRTHEVDVADFEPGADHEDLSQDDLEVDDGLEFLKDEDVEASELKPMDVSSEISGTDDAMEGLDELAAADRRKQSHGYSQSKGNEVSAKATGVAGLKLPVPAYKRAKLEAVNSGLEELARGDEKRDELKRKLASGEIPKPVSTRAREIKDRIAERDANIARLEQSTEDFKAEKVAIEAQSAKRLKAIEIGSRANMAANAMAFEERAKPMREVAREIGREAGRQEVAREQAPMMAELEVSADGKITGLKNLLLVRPDSFVQAMSARMEAIKNETIHLLSVVRDNIDNDRLKALEQESQEWMEMYRDMKAMKDAGVSNENAHVNNRFYKNIDVVVPEGLDQSEAETIAITPEEELEARLEMLNTQDKKIDGLLQQAGEALREVDDTDIAKSAQEKRALSDFLKGAESYRAERKAMLQDKIALLEVMDRPEYLDVKSKKLNQLIQRSENQIVYLQHALQSVKEKGTMDAIKEKIDDVEGQMTTEKADLEEWQNYPLRQEALNARRVDLQEKIRSLKMQSDRQDLVGYNPGPEATEAIHQSAEEAMKAYRAEIVAARDQIHALIRQKADIANERAAILNERIDRELAKFEYDVDLKDLNERAQGIEGIDVDTVEFDGEDVDLTDLNERVEGYKDIDVDTSDFEKKPKKASRVKSVLNAIRKKAA